MKKLLLLDIDGVVLDWNSGFKNYLLKRGITVNGCGPDDWSMKTWINYEGSIRELIEDFNSTPDFGLLKAFQGAYDTLNALSEEFEIVAITSCGGRKDLRVHNLKNIFGVDFFAAIHCLDLSESKKDYLSKYPEAIWIEDNSDNAILGLECGHKVILFEASHNRLFKHNDIKRVKNWEEVIEAIKSFGY